MDPIIYQFPVNEDDKKLKIKVDHNHRPSPKLIKYGFTNINCSLDMVELTSNSCYQAGLKFNFDDKSDNSVTKAASTYFNMIVDETFMEFWEIITLFGLLEKKQTIYCHNYDNVMDELNKFYQTISKEKSKLVKNQKEDATLVINKYSLVNIDENAALELIVQDLKNLMGRQKKGANFVLQLFDIQTQPTVELIYYLSSLYHTSYIIKPSITSDLSDCKYLVLIGLKEETKIDLTSKNVNIASFGLSIPNEITTLVQCFNSIVMPLKYQRYHLIKSYLETCVKFGGSYNELIAQQKSNAQKWIETFSDMEKVRKMIEELTEKYNKICHLIDNSKEIPI